MAPRDETVGLTILFWTFFLSVAQIQAFPRSCCLSQSTTKLCALPTYTKQPDERKPKYYWNNIENVRFELRAYWEDLNITEFEPNLPPIPSEALLNHFSRHDLRQVIIKYGGREDLAEILGGSEVIPGKWKVAVETSRFVQELLKNPLHGLYADIPPLSPQQKKVNITSYESRSKFRWSYKNPDRRPHSYWTLGVLIESLYNYLDQASTLHNRPSVWMPRPAEIKQAGQEGLYQAIRRGGGGNKIAKVAGLVPHNEWWYFDGQLELMKDLVRYLDEFHGGNHTIFPAATEIKLSGYSSLYNAIQRYGGYKFLLTRFGMETVDPRRSRDYLEMNFGPFSIDFAIALLDYIRNDQLQRQPPLKMPVIRMPTEYELFSNGRNDLIDGVQKYGGYENVARRLGLDYLDPTTSVRSSGGRQR